MGTVPISALLRTEAGNQYYFDDDGHFDERVVRTTYDAFIAHPQAPPIAAPLSLDRDIQLDVELPTHDFAIFYDPGPVALDRDPPFDPLTPLLFVRTSGSSSAAQLEPPSDGVVRVFEGSQEIEIW